MQYAYPCRYVRLRRDGELHPDTGDVMVSDYLSLLYTANLFIRHGSATVTDVYCDTFPRCWAGLDPNGAKAPLQTEKVLLVCLSALGKEEPTQSWITSTRCQRSPVS